MIETIEFGALKWHHIQNPSEEDLEFLEDNFHFHPLDIEDCRSTNQRPKIDIYDDYNFLILHFPGFDKQGKTLKVREAKIFWVMLCAKVGIPASKALFAFSAAKESDSTISL